MWWILLEFELQIFKDNAMVHVTLGLSWTSRQFGVQSPEPRPHVSVLCGICGPCTWDLGSRRGWKETEAAHWFLTDLHPVHAWESCSTVTTSQHGWHCPCCPTELQFRARARPCQAPGELWILPEWSSASSASHVKRGHFTFDTKRQLVSFTVPGTC